MACSKPEMIPSALARKMKEERSSFLRNPASLYDLATSISFLSKLAHQPCEGSEYGSTRQALISTILRE